MRRKPRLIFSEHFLSKIDDHSIPICKCSSENRNNNACINHQHTQPQLYSHIRKIYNHETALLEYARIIMSTIKPIEDIEERQDEQTIGQRRRRRTRVSKQRAKVLISEYCTRKIPENIKISTNKQNHSSVCFSSFQ